MSAISLTSSAKRFCVISYDIVQDRRRNQVMKLLKGYGFHVQKSVFECILSEPKLKKLLELLEEKIDPATDSIRVYQLCNDCNKTILVYGQGKVSEISLVEIV